MKRIPSLSERDTRCAMCAEHCVQLENSRVAQWRHLVACPIERYPKRFSFRSHALVETGRVHFAEAWQRCHLERYRVPGAELSRNERDYSYNQSRAEPLESLSLSLIRTNILTSKLSTNQSSHTELLQEAILLLPAVVRGRHGKVAVELLAQLREEVSIAQVLSERRQIVEIARRRGRRGASSAVGVCSGSDGRRERMNGPREWIERWRLGALLQEGRSGV